MMHVVVGRQVAGLLTLAGDLDRGDGPFHHSQTTGTLHVSLILADTLEM
jgi:hypothetical protein